MGDKVKKKFYKRWWFWVIVVVVIFAAAGNGNYNNSVADNNTNETVETNKPKEEKKEDKKEYTPKEVSEYNTIYRNTTNKEKDGSYPTINISKVEKRDKDIVVSIGAPTYTQIGYAFDNFLFVRPLDVNGKELALDKLNLKAIGGDVEAELVITGVDIEKVKWLEIGPYKTGDNNPLVFKVE